MGTSSIGSISPGVSIEARFTQGETSYMRRGERYGDSKIPKREGVCRDFARLSIARMIEIDAGEWVVGGENETNSVTLMPHYIAECAIEVRPRAWNRSGGVPAGVWIDADLRFFALAVFKSPAHGVQPKIARENGWFSTVNASEMSERV